MDDSVGLNWAPVDLRSNFRGCARAAFCEPQESKELESQPAHVEIRRV